MYLLSFTVYRVQSIATHTRLWYHIDGRDQVVGRVAVVISKLLQGKNKPIYHPAGEDKKNERFGRLFLSRFYTQLTIPYVCVCVCECTYFSAFSGHGRSCSGYKHKASRILWKQVEPKVIQTSHRVGLG